MLLNLNMKLEPVQMSYSTGFYGFDVFHVFLPKLCEFIHISLEYDPADITRWISPHIRRFSTAYTSFEENTQF